MGVAAPGLRNALLGGLAGLAATSLGALPALVLRGISQKLEDSLLGMAAGMMLAASAFSLLLPGLASGAAILGHKGSVSYTHLDVYKRQASSCIICSSFCFGICWKYAV